MPRMTIDQLRELLIQEFKGRVPGETFQGFIDSPQGWSAQTDTATGVITLVPRVEMVTRAKTEYRQLTYPGNLGEVLEVGKVVVPGRKKLAQPAFFERQVEVAGLQHCRRNFDGVTWEESSAEDYEVIAAIIYMGKDYVPAQEAEERAHLYGFSRLASPPEGFALAARDPELQRESYYGCFGAPGSRRRGRPVGVLFRESGGRRWADDYRIGHEFDGPCGVLVVR